MPAEDPALVERFFMEALDFRPAEPLITVPRDPELIGTWMYCGESPHDIAFIKGPNGKLHHFAFHLATGATSSRPATSSRWTTSRSTSGRPGTGSPAARTIYFFDPSGNRNEVFAGGYRTGPDFPTITWTQDQLGKGIFYITRELNDRFTTVFT